jgi:hypothetical protein
MGKYGKIPTKMGIEALKNGDFFFWTFVGIYIYNKTECCGKPNTIS